ncbi:polyunsaturated fatty acid lipoxygenase ALOX15B-like [Octopus vulgaris]|uniref:Polyunsaturated fatty acid lipoxygenase ALOX15B-like n=1 Tax=Octopus vulgaris TaxID=6645 RepID=A0AA36B606_OCTVU|nr:polyunsaturated fatty acid lipoxygenase ALOX15B-like [Octopus vulgaris]
MDDLMTSSHQGAAPNIGIFSWLLPGSRHPIDLPPLTREKDPCKAERINEMQKNRDLYKLKYVEGFPLKDSLKHWKEDTWFGYQRLNRCNPKSIRLCEEIPSKLGVDKVMMEPVLKGETLEGLIKKKRLFYTDLEILDGLTHMLMQIVIAHMHRNIYPTHPIYKILAPHTYLLMFMNDLAFERLINPGAWVDQTMTIGSDGLIELVCKGIQEWDFYRDGIPDNDFANRKGLPMKDGKGHVSSKEDLKWIVSVIIFTCSVSHAAVNFLQYDEYGHPANYPSMLRTPLLKDKAPRTEKDIVDALPERAKTLWYFRFRLVSVLHQTLLALSEQVVNTGNNNNYNKHNIEEQQQQYHRHCGLEYFICETPLLLETCRLVTMATIPEDGINVPYVKMKF